jgi:hypothetical protein
MQLLCISGIFIFMKYKKKILFMLFLLQIKFFIIELCLLHYIMQNSYQQLCACVLLVF